MAAWVSNQAKCFTQRVGEQHYFCLLWAGIPKLQEALQLTPVRQFLDWSYHLCHHQSGCFVLLKHRDGHCPAGIELSSLASEAQKETRSMLPDVLNLRC
jgi:hypothetical protein